MAKNEFLAFGVADGANVLTTDEYQKLTARSNGFSAGVARSQEFNTVWRQASVIAHVVAQFIADTNNTDVADDGDLDKLQAALIQALSKNVNNTVPAASLKTAGISRLSSATDSDSETIAATPKAVKAAYDIAASSAVKSVNGKNGDVQLTASDVGALAQTGGTVTGTLHVDGDLTAKAATFGGNITVSWGGRTAIHHENGDVTGPIWGGALSAWLNKQLQNRTRTQVSGGRGGWWYKDELSGFVFQGGVITRSGNNNIVTFPVSYQRECFGVQMTLSAWKQSSGNNIFATGIKNSGFTAVMYEQEIEANWWAVGV